MAHEHNRDAALEPSRIRAARFSRMMSPVDLAKRINCSPSYLAEMELGKKAADKYIEPLVEGLRYPREFFFLPPVPDPERFSYRKRAKMKVVDKHSMESLGAIFASNFSRLITTYVNAPAPTVPDLSSIADSDDVLFCAETAASIIRERFGMGNAPLRSALDLVESLGVHVFWVDGPPEFDAVSFWIYERPYILINRHFTDGYRVRFTVLHEAFHLLAHKKLAEQGKFQDRQADAFASAMLMPAGLYKQAALRRFDPYALLDDRSIWGASARAQVRRAYDLHLMSDWAYRDAFIRMNQMWGSTEPRPASVESSSVHKFFFDEAGDKGKYSADLADEASMPYDLFLAAFPDAEKYERSANMMPRAHS